VTVIQAEVAKAVAAPVSPAFVRDVLRHAVEVPEVAARLASDRATVAVRITGDRELRRLNRDYAGEDAVTDVLSFAGEGDHLGDLAISWPMVRRQAAAHGHLESAELALLCVHGLLHLLGWDHATAIERREMNRISRAALKKSGLALAPGRL
jgi:probable rRNA maturation factor